ncbi:PIG-L family deacetylase [Methanobacterium formicicum]|uniref:LmbE family protein n=1 Tax=Methanobacterium formicicum (strain DSM 3637 / PP1) TaxID=1204725 RepID=K2QEP8_METFP|nr:PIG-L family deacetylase [Methanobacterium formicicum]EKF86566.1 LmbE family protein [Methanobacterium formicicum DSM 3637]
MKRTFHILFITIPLLLLITLFPVLSASDTSQTNGTQNGTNTSSSAEKVAFIIPHPDDETIGAGGTIGKLMANGTKIHFELMASGDGQGATLLNVTNYYKIDIPANSSSSYTKKLIREDSFKRVMTIYGCDDYNIQGYDDGTLTAAEVFTTMEDLYLNQGCTVFYTVTGDGNSDHMACYQGMLMMEMKYPNLEYREFPIYYYHASRPASLALTNNTTDEDVSQYTSKKLSAFQVYYNINTIHKIFYPYSDGLYSSSPERMYYIN